MNAISAAAAVAPRSERFWGCTARAAARNYRRLAEGGSPIDSREAPVCFHSASLFTEMLFLRIER